MCLLITIYPIRARVSLISSKYPIWCRYTFEPCRHDFTRAFVYPSCSVIQEKVVSDRTEGSSSFQLSGCPFCYVVNASCIISCAPPSFINLGTRFLLSGEGCNIPCYDFTNHLLITFISSLTTHQIPGSIKF
jgi:hypothetical protein